MRVATVLFGNDRKKLAFASVKFDEWTDFERLLTDSERRVAGGFASEKRRTEFFAGRVAARLALTELHGSESVTILNNDAGVPVVSNEKLAVSISHSEDIAVALAFESDFSFGIDIQIIRAKSVKALKRLVTEKFVPDDAMHLTVAWAIKEALSKCLKTGFTIPYEEFLLADFIKNRNLFECTFVKYPQYIGRAVLWKNYAIAIVGNKEYMADMEIENLLASF